MSDLSGSIAGYCGERQGQVRRDAGSTHVTSALVKHSIFATQQRPRTSPRSGSSRAVWLGIEMIANHTHIVQRLAPATKVETM